MKVRRAKLEDCRRLLELINELALFEKAPHEVTVTLEEFEFAGFSEHPVWWAFVVEVDGVIQGFALYFIRYSTWKGCRMYLEDIIITEEYRGKGLGKLLFDQLIIEAVERNLKGITWQVLEWNEDAIEFYKKYNAGIDPEWVNGSLSQEQIQYFYEQFVA
ncbi:MAG: GNAT family N-acetyltransferase [bacterium]|jgi:GNAT superfamily N-acetyltransferase